MAQGVPMEPVVNAAQEDLPWKSQYRGLSWDRREQRWRVRINYGGKQRQVGRFQSEKEAARAFDRAALALYGPAAKTNFGLQSALEDPIPVSPHIRVIKQQVESSIWSNTASHAAPATANHGSADNTSSAFAGLSQLNPAVHSSAAAAAAGGAGPGQVLLFSRGGDVMSNLATSSFPYSYPAPAPAPVDGGSSYGAAQALPPAVGMPLASSTHQVLPQHHQQQYLPQQQQQQPYSVAGGPAAVQPPTIMAPAPPHLSNMLPMVSPAAGGAGVPAPWAQLPAGGGRLVGAGAAAGTSGLATLGALPQQQLQLLVPQAAGQVSSHGVLSGAPAGNNLGLAAALSSSGGGLSETFLPLTSPTAPLSSMNTPAWPPGLTGAGASSGGSVNQWQGVQALPGVMARAGSAGWEAMPSVQGPAYQQQQQQQLLGGSLPGQQVAPGPQQQLWMATSMAMQPQPQPQQVGLSQAAGQQQLADALLAAGRSGLLNVDTRVADLLSLVQASQQQMQQVQQQQQVGVVQQMTSQQQQQQQQVLLQHALQQQAQQQQQQQQVQQQQQGLLEQQQVLQMLAQQQQQAQAQAQQQQGMLMAQQNMLMMQAPQAVAPPPAQVTGGFSIAPWQP